MGPLAEEVAMSLHEGDQVCGVTLHAALHAVRCHELCRVVTLCSAASRHSLKGSLHVACHALPHLHLSHGILYIPPRKRAIFYANFLCGLRSQALLVNNY